MRPALFTATAAFALLAACGGPETSQANNSAANISGEAAPPASADGSAVSAGAPLGAPVSGDQAKALMNERHEGMEDIGDAMKVLSRELKGNSPDLAAVRSNAATIANLAPKVSGWFPPGTGPDVGKTEAKAEIWQKPDDFAAKARDFQQAAQAFNAAAQASDVAAIKAAFGNLGKSCKACHDPYRQEQKKH
ncbi:MAG TPA: cytochrome c [Sphingomicrobium sp.]|nr:cytochrome c [Sphingomicrobium sp.]